jgi:hypothetical protein
VNRLLLISARFLTPIVARAGDMELKKTPFGLGAEVGFGLLKHHNTFIGNYASKAPQSRPTTCGSQPSYCTRSRCTTETLISIVFRSSRASRSAGLRHLCPRILRQGGEFDSFGIRSIQFDGTGVLNLIT